MKEKYQNDKYELFGHYEFIKKYNPLTLHLDIVGANIALRSGSNILLSKRTKSRSVDRVGGGTSNGGKSDSGGKLHG